jgi:hypothetical protein
MVLRPVRSVPSLWPWIVPLLTTVMFPPGLPSMPLATVDWTTPVLTIVVSFLTSIPSEPPLTTVPALNGVPGRVGDGRARLDAHDQGAAVAEEAVRVGAGAVGKAPGLGTIGMDGTARAEQGDGHKNTKRDCEEVFTNHGEFLLLLTLKSDD